MTSPSAGAVAPPVHAGKPPKRRIRNYILDPRFQFKYTGLIVAVAIALLTALGALVWIQAEKAAVQAERAMLESQTSSRIMRMDQLMNAADNPELVHTIEQQLAEGDRQAERNLHEVQAQRRRMLITLIAAGLAFIVLLGAAGIVITHKVVGPVYKLKRLLRQVGSGRLNIQERLRKGDELEDLFETFLQMVESLKRSQEVELSKLEAVIKDLESSVQTPSGTYRDSAAAGAALERLRVLRTEMLDALGVPESIAPPG